MVVDASAEVVHSMNGETTLRRQGMVKTPTMIFRMGGVDIDLFMKIDPAKSDRKIAEALNRERSAFHTVTYSRLDAPAKTQDSDGEIGMLRSDFERGTTRWAVMT